MPENISVRAATKCTDYAPLLIKTGRDLQTTCTSTQPTAHCNAGCKPNLMTTKMLSFKCTGGYVDEFTTQFTVPVSCTTA